MEQFPNTLMELEKKYSSEDTCLQYLFELRWPDGFICPRAEIRKPGVPSETCTSADSVVTRHL